MTDGTQGAARRVVRNTAVRGAAEMAGKVITLALMVVLARAEGPAGVGALVFGLAWGELSTVPINMGFDRHMTRLLAARRDRLGELLWNVLVLKARRALPVLGAGVALLLALGYEGETRTAVLLLTLTFLIETVRWTQFAVFTAFERADLIGGVLVVQRLCAGGLSLLLLALGEGVVAVAAAYVVGAVAGVAAGTRLLARHIGLPALQLPAGPRLELRRGSIPFAAQDVLGAGIGRLDAVLLSLLTTQAVVGLYGAAYRLLEATLVVSTSLLGAFSAMFTYLDEHSSPTIRAAYGRSLKMAIVLLVPCAVPMAVVPGPLLELLFGERFVAAQDALRLLAPAVVLLGVVMLTVSLVSSRLDPRLAVRTFAAAVVLNVGANLLLIPPLGVTGAALAMLLAELLIAVVLVRLAVRAIGAPDLRATAGGAAVAGAVMTATILLVPGPLVLALAAGAVAYPLALWVVERRLAPADVDHLRAALSTRLRPSRA